VSLRSMASDGSDSVGNICCRDAGMVDVCFNLRLGCR
jgi:hypothetical protein